jgi:hypothetical protein
MKLITSKTMYERIIDEVNAASRAGRVTECIELTESELAEVYLTCPKCLLESLPYCLGVIPIKVDAR